MAKRDALDDYADARDAKRARPDGASSLAELRKIYEETTPWRNNVNAKLEAAAPYYFFLTRVKDLPQTYDEDLSISFQEILDSSLGDLEHTLHVNFMVDLSWLLAQYAIVGRVNPPLTILYGVDDPDLTNIPTHLNVTAIKVKLPSPFGHHHTKMSVFFYRDKSVRFLVSTANLVESDWENRTQGVWISPRCPPLADDEPIYRGESPTLFKANVLQYLNSYHIKESRPWLKRIQRLNVESIKVFLVSSIPGTEDSDKWGRRRLGRLLKQHVSYTDSGQWPIVVQCSSIGSLGPSASSWLTGEFAKSLERSPNYSTPSVHVIYPSLRNVKTSLDGMLGGACLPYATPTHVKQNWLNTHLKQWRSESRSRSRAVPHIKTYCKVSPDNSKLAWFLLTSANLSKAAWGMPTKAGDRILSYESGVLFLPKLIIGKDEFIVRRGKDSGNPESFPLPYDLPLIDYEPSDKIFLYDKCFGHPRS